jgi:hypothetical protein
LNISKDRFERRYQILAYTQSLYYISKHRFEHRYQIPAYTLSLYYISKDRFERRYQIVGSREEPRISRPSRSVLLGPEKLAAQGDLVVDGEAHAKTIVKAIDVQKNNFKKANSE